MAYSLVQCPTEAFVSGASTISKNFASTPAVGNLIVVGITTYDVAIGLTDVSDNQGNTYTRRSTTSSATYAAIFSAIAATSSGTFTVTFNPTGTGDLTFIIAEFSGNAATPFDQQNAATGSSASVSTGNVTPTETNELLFAVMGHEGTTRTITPAGDWTELQEDESADHMTIAAEYKIQTSIATEDANWTLGTGAATYVACIASFKAAAASGPGPVSETEGITLGESVTVSAPDPKLLTKTENVTLTETVLAAISDLTVDKSENVTLGETAAAEVGATSDQTISVTDSLTLGETVTISIPDALAISKTDNVTLGESVTVSGLEIVEDLNILIDPSVLSLWTKAVEVV